MRFYKHLYVSDLVGKRKDKVIEKLKEGTFPLTYNIIVLAEDGENQLEFYPMGFLKQHNLNKEDLFVVGIATCQMDAIYLIEEITNEVYAKTGDADIRSYILKKENK